MLRRLPIQALLRSAIIILVSGPALSAGVPLADLRGYTVTAEWTIEENETSTWHPNTERKVAKHFSEKIYISQRERFFHIEGKTIGGYARGSRAAINSRSGDEVIYNPQVGLVDRVIPSDTNIEQTTFARVTRIEVSRHDGLFSCEISAALVLKR